MQELRRIAQPTPWSCIAAVAVMIAGETMDDFFRHVGHDGGEIVPDSPFQDGRRGFRWGEVVGYLAARGYHLGLDWHQSRGRMSAEHPALLIVAGQSANHAVLWTGREVVDPHPERDGARRLEEYCVMQWWPIQRIELP